MTTAEYRSSITSLLPLLQYTEYHPSLSASTSSLLSPAAAATGVSAPKNDITGISSLAGLFLFETVGDVEGPAPPSPHALFSPLGGFCSRNLSGEDGEEDREEEEGEWVRVRDDLSGEDDEREDLQKREDGTLDGEKTGEFEIATVQDIF